MRGEGRQTIQGVEKNRKEKEMFTEVQIKPEVDMPASGCLLCVPLNPPSAEL